MPFSREYEAPRVDNGLGLKYVPTYRYYGWNTSPRRPDGSLNLQANYMSRTTRDDRTVARRIGGSTAYKRAIYGNSGRYNSPQSADGAATAQATNAAYSRLISKIKSDEASLGVTFASWRQSWTMIALRATQLRKLASKAERDAARENKRREALRRSIRRQRRKGQPIRVKPRDYLPVSSANVFLEGLFGWLPLLSDIHSAAMVLTGGIPPHFVSETATVRKVLPYPINSSYRTVAGSASLTVRVNQACFVRVSNPNVWLANQLGLLNPAMVAWDLVPWSFLVNMFVNVNQVLSSMSDLVGVQLSNPSTTTLWTVVEEAVNRSSPGDTDQIEEYQNLRRSYKSRTLGLTLPSLKVRLPSVDMTKGLMAFSLLTQQLARLEFSKTSFYLK